MNTLLIVDFDSTFIRDETLDEIANLLLSSNRISKNTQEKITKITNQAMNGELDFRQALKKRVKLLNIHKNDIGQVISILNERVSLSFIQNKEYIQTVAKSIYIVSGGFKEIIEPIVKEYGISRKNIFANEFIYDSNGYINGINEESLLSHSDGKIRATKTLNLSNGGYVIGDGSTDLEIKTVEGIKAFICFTENVDRKAVSNKADYIASDFHEVIKIINCND
tara:strand:+ start:692 stop:1360 length:669 start_codon:yes stop_codon:yes gene_type:complete